MLGSSGIHGSFTPQDRHTVASRATRVAHSRQGTVSTGTSVMRSAYALLHEDPFRLEQWERNERNDRRGGHEQGIADLPAEQDHEAPERDERGEPVADRNLSEQDAGTEDRADGRGVSAL